METVETYIETGNDPIKGLQWIENTEYLMVCTRNAIQLWLIKDTTSEQIVLFSQLQDMVDLKVCPHHSVDKKWLVAVKTQDQVSVLSFSLSNVEILYSIPEVSAICWNGLDLITGHFNGFITRHDHHSQNRNKQVFKPHRGAVSSILVVDSDMFSSGMDGLIKKTSLAGHSIFGEELTHMISPQGRLVVVEQLLCCVDLWDGRLNAVSRVPSRAWRDNVSRPKKTKSKRAPRDARVSETRDNRQTHKTWDKIEVADAVGEYIGTVDGSVFHGPLLLRVVQGGITRMALDHTRLATGTLEGRVAIDRW